MRLLQTTTKADKAASNETGNQEAKGETMSKAPTASQRAAKMPDSYFELVKHHPLASIRSDAELDAAQAVIDRLLTQNLDRGGQAYLDALSDLVIIYEQEHYAIEPLPPHRLLAEMLKERNMSQADLVRATGISKASVSNLITGQRAFTVAQMQTVAQIFGLPGRGEAALGALLRPARRARPQEARR